MSRRANLTLLAGFILAIWAVELVNGLLLGHSWSRYGIEPRTVSVEGVRGILLSPFLHKGFGHLAANTLPLLILGGLAGARSRTNLLLITVVIIVVGGFGVWAIGRSGPHIGASGLVFGYFGYLVARGWYERSILSIAVALAVIGVFGLGMLQGIVPTAGERVSWEGHLCGLAAGGLAAWLLRERGGE